MHIDTAASNSRSSYLSTMRWISLIFASLVLVACQTQGTAIEAISAPSSSVAARAVQSQTVEAKSDTIITRTVVDTLQDFGFEITESSLVSGIVSGAKKQKTGNFYGLNADVRVSVSISPIRDERSTVRVSFQKIIPSHDPRLYRSEAIEDQSIYRDFFDKLKQALFLSKNET